MYELTKENYYKVKEVFNELSNHLSIYGVIEQINPGRIFVDDKENPETGFIMSPEGLFFSGKDNEEFNQALNNILKVDIIPNALKNEKVDYVIYYSQQLEKSIHQAFEGLYPMKDQRYTLEILLKDYEPIELPSNIRQVDQELLTSSIDGVDDLKEEILTNWKSLDDFIEKGFGYVYILDNIIVSRSTTDVVVYDRSEIGVETHPEHRRNGYSTNCVQAMLNHCKNRKIKKVGWHCWESNLPSYKTATKVGFKEIEHRDVYFAYYEKLANYITNGNHYFMNDKDYEKALKFYSLALDQDYGQLWHYYNASCLAFKYGDKFKAKAYYLKAKEKGWKGLSEWNPKWIRFVYHENDADFIEQALSK